MRFENIKNLDEEKFRRLTGVKRNTFNEMIRILIEAENKKRRLGGPRNKMALEDRLLMTLEYLREYRTYFHISQSYNISESACYRIIKWTEDSLIILRSGLNCDLSFPGSTGESRKMLDPAVKPRGDKTSNSARLEYSDYSHLL